jgi:hypothetical protein
MLWIVAMTPVAADREGHSSNRIFHRAKGRFLDSARIGADPVSGGSDREGVTFQGLALAWALLLACRMHWLRFLPVAVAFACTSAAQQDGSGPTGAPPPPPVSSSPAVPGDPPLTGEPDAGVRADVDAGVEGGSDGHTGPASIYPNPALTPGDVLAVTNVDVCAPGYASGVRDVSAKEKAMVFQRYGLADVAGMYEVDHFISLELGGSNAVENLWPEPYAPPPGAKEKDRVENFLHAQVCSGKMTLRDAQEAIRTDWYRIFLSL